MPKQSSKPKSIRDENQLAYDAVRHVIRQTEGQSELAAAPARPKKKNPAAVALGRLGGLKGGKARAATLTDERRKQIASVAARTRWAQTRKKQELLKGRVDTATRKGK